MPKAACIGRILTAVRDRMPVMQIGIILPQNEIGDDPGAIREFAAAAEDEGFQHIVAFDHVVGKDDYASQPFHEPFVLFGFIAGVHAHDRAR